jgi:N-acyl-D-aspartate/D-glutamate deacylase
MTFRPHTQPAGDEAVQASAGAERLIPRQALPREEAPQALEETELAHRARGGMGADITIFDPMLVRDNSSLEKGKNALPTTGIPYVVVNATIVVRDSKVSRGVYPGQAIRLPVQK